MRTVERGAAARLLQLPNLPQHFGELRGAYSITRKEQLLRIDTAGLECVMDAAAAAQGGRIYQTALLLVNLTIEGLGDVLAQAAEADETV